MTITVGVVSICGGEHLERCLAALARQASTSPVEVVVAFPERRGPGGDVTRAHPGARWLPGASPAPPDLAAHILRESTGEIVLLTEDHCEPSARWVHQLAAALGPGRSAVGGPVAVARDAGLVDWAFWFSDYFRVASPGPGGPAAALSVCNAGYRRRDLEATGSLGRTGFVEGAAHAALAARFGPLWMVPGAGVVTRRRVSLRDGVRERMSFGHLHGSVMSNARSPLARAFRAARAPVVPGVLLARMAQVAWANPSLRARFVRALPLLCAFAVAWAWGEALGYLFGRPPAALSVAGTPVTVLSPWPAAGR